VVRRLGLAHARHVIKEVGAAAASWRRVAKVLGLKPAEIEWMASAFEHDDLARAVAL
jgi:serine/threonine-protein kinase HipA